MALQLRLEPLSMRSLSILLFGNTNNYPFYLAEGLRSLGHKVQLIVNRSERLHRPEAVNPAWNGEYPSWILDFSDVADEDFAFSTEKFKALLRNIGRPYDLGIFNDIGPALASHIQFPHVAFLTGSDLSYYCDYNMLAWRSLAWGRDFKYSPAGRDHLRHFCDLITSQRQGIETAELVSFAHRGLLPDGDRLLDSIGVSDDRRTMFFFTDVQRTISRPVPSGTSFRILSGCRVVFDQGRHPAMSPQDFKGTDKLLRGFKRYCDLGGSGELRLPEKGQDVDLAKAIIKEMQLGNRVVWLPEMALTEFHEEMAQAHVVCDQFGPSFPGMVTVDAFAVGRPVIANLRNEVFARHMPAPLPGRDAKTPDEIARALLEFEKDRDLLVQTGAECRRYAEQYLSAQSAAAEILKRVGLVNP